MNFQYQIIRIIPSAAIYGRAGCITFHTLQFGRALGIPFNTTNNSFFKCQNDGLTGIQLVWYWNEQKFRCRNQSGSRIRGPSPVPDWDSDCQNADAFGIDLDAEARLRLLDYRNIAYKAGKFRNLWTIRCRIKASIYRNIGYQTHKKLLVAQLWKRDASNSRDAGDYNTSISRMPTAEEMQEAVS